MAMNFRNGFASRRARSLADSVSVPFSTLRRAALADSSEAMPECVFIDYQSVAIISGGMTSPNHDVRKVRTGSWPGQWNFSAIAD